MFSLTKYLTYLLAICSTVFAQNIIQLRNSHKALDLSENQVNYLSSLSDTAHINKLLDNILITRVVGTQNHEKVYQFIKAELSRQGFEVETDEATQQTPIFGALKFRNIIGSLNPNAERFLVLACHYDSKYFEDIEFIGAVDSGVPCAMMLNLAKVLKKELQQIKGNNDLSLKLVFFDGEEAFETWGPKDSIYGARNLASKWNKNKSKTKSGLTVTDLHRIDVMVLLDLIGAPGPKFSSYFRDTERWYLKLADAEKSLAKKGLLARYSKSQPYFSLRSSESYIEDDHIPFLNKGVPILHLIPTPFPKVWHKESDNRDALDLNTIENINKILRIFVAQYLHLSV